MTTDTGISLLCFGDFSIFFMIFSKHYVICRSISLEDFEACGGLYHCSQRHARHLSCSVSRGSCVSFKRCETDVTRWKTDTTAGVIILPSQTNRLLLGARPAPALTTSAAHRQLLARFSRRLYSTAITASLPVGAPIRAWALVMLAFRSSPVSHRLRDIRRVLPRHGDGHNTN